MDGRLMRGVPLLLLLAAPLTAQVADSAEMARATALLERACAADGGATWGRPVCGPLLLGHWGSKRVIASVPDSAGRFVPAGRWWVGELAPEQFPSNTALRVGGTHYSMVVLPLPADDATATTLLAHEQFHRIQGALGLPPQDPGAEHLDEEDARRWLRLEYRALARAIEATGATSCGHARDALAFRAARAAAFPGSGEREAALERHEGLAEYTGQRLAALAFGDGPRRTAAFLEQAEAVPSFVRSFAYATGAGYGTLLDRVDPRWRGALASGGDPAALLATRLSCPATGDAAGRAGAYGGEELAAAERLRADSLTRIRADYLARLVEGPVLRTPPGALSFTFDPGAVTPLPGHGTVHRTGTFSGPWGSLEVTAGGALVSADFQVVRVALPSDGVSTWRLTLSPDWRLVAEGGDLVPTPPGS